MREKFEGRGRTRTHEEMATPAILNEPTLTNTTKPRLHLTNTNTSTPPPAKKAKEICAAYNAGTCSARGKCLQNPQLLHACSLCGQGGHPAYACRRNGNEQQKAKGKSKGKRSGGKAGEISK